MNPIFMNFSHGKTSDPKRLSSHISDKIHLKNE